LSNVTFGASGLMNLVSGRMLRAFRSIGPAFAVAAMGAALALHGSWNKSETADERGHITSGHSYWVNDDYRLQPENGNLTQRMIALPNIMAGAVFPTLESEEERPTLLYVIGYRYFYGSTNDATVLLRRGRAVVAVVTALIGVALFSISATISGIAGAWITLILFAFSPTVLANGALATSDMIAAGAFIIATWAVWATLERITPRNIVLATLAVAALLLSKFSAPILLPIALCLMVIRVLERRPLRVQIARTRLKLRSRPQKALAVAAAAGLVAIPALAMIWAAYGFRYQAFNPALPGLAQFDPPWAEITLTPAIGAVINWMRDHRPLPEAYLYGTSHVLFYSDRRLQFLNGVVSTNGGWRIFFPYAALVKSTPSELLLALAGALAAGAMLLRRRAMTIRKRLRARRLLPFLLLAGWYAAFAIASPLNIGYRHVLPVVLVSFILAGVVALPLKAQR
jgi:hypothetical protein